MTEPNPRSIEFEVQLLKAQRALIEHYQDHKPHPNVVAMATANACLLAAAGDMGPGQQQIVADTVRRSSIQIAYAAGWYDHDMQRLSEQLEGNG